MMGFNYLLMRVKRRVNRMSEVGRMSSGLHQMTPSPTYSALHIHDLVIWVVYVES